MRVVVLFIFFSCSLLGQEPVFQWQFSKEQYKGGMITPTKGRLKLSAENAGFCQDEPTALITGNEALKVVNGEGQYPQKAISVAAWVKAEKAPKWAGINTLIQDNGKYKRGFFLGSRFNKFSFSVAGVKRQSLYYMTSKTPFSTGFWYYVVGTYDGTYQRLYIDGKLDSTYKSNGGDISYPEVQLPTVGAFKDDDETHPFHGKINELNVYDTALSAEYIQKEFEKHKDQFPGIEGTLNNDGQWPTYLGNNERQAASPTELPFPLKQAWSYKARHKPAPAWPLPAKMDYWRKTAPNARVIFDRAYHLVGQGNLLYFGSSADHKIYCLDNRTGKEVWSYFTEGPVRLAPSVYEGKVYTGSDDGYVYCNDAATGKLIWKQRLAKEDVRLPGNERMISQWPVRTGVIIEDKIAHFCAGLFPSQGVFRGGADVESGKILANLKLWYSAQGYMKSNSGQIEFSQGRQPAKKFLVTLKRNFKSLSQEMLLLPKEYSHAFIKAGNAHIGGGDGKIIAIDGTKNKVPWRAEVTGKVYSLAVINGRLYASTDEGFIYCFTGKAGAAKAIANNITKKLPYTSKSDQERTEKITRFLLKKRPQLHKGYALVASLSVKEIYSLCKYSDYQVIAIENDAAKIDKMRQHLDVLGLYGTRVTVQQTLAKKLPYVDGIFNLIFDPGQKLSKEEKQRVLQPYTGLALSGSKYRTVAAGIKPKGAGEWTNMYGNAANTNCSNEANVGTKLAIQWFGPPGPRKMVDRHHRTIAPLSHNGRLFIPGENVIICSDAWNGTVLWELPVTDSIRIMAQKDCSYISVDEKYLYVAAKNKCLVVDVRNGKVVRELKTNQENTEWGYVGLTKDMVIGSSVSEGAIRRHQSHKNTTDLTHHDYVPVITSSILSGTKKGSQTATWTYVAKGGISNTSICIYKGNIYFIESHDSEKLGGQQKLETLLAKGSSIVCLNSKTGQVLWRMKNRVSKFRHNMSLSAANGVLVCSGAFNNYEAQKRGNVRYELYTMDAQSGKYLWGKEMNPNLKGGGTHGEPDRRPVIVGDKLYLEPNRYDLKTGKDDKEFTYSITKRKGCGQITASSTAMYFRNATAGSFDLGTNKLGKVTYITRPGCWLNMIPASGLLLIPEASSGCVCNYAIQTSMAFRARKE